MTRKKLRSMQANQQPIVLISINETIMIQFSSVHCTHILVRVRKFSLAHLANVGAGSERLGTSGNDHAPDIILLVEGRRRVDEVVKQCIAQSIEGLGPVEGDETNAAFGGTVLRETTLDENVFIFLGVGGTCGREGTRGGASGGSSSRSSR